MRHLAVLSEATRRSHLVFQAMMQHEYGSYEEYVRCQIAGNREKLAKVWAQRPNINHIARHIRKRIGRPKFGICHGTRRGVEQQWFRAALKKCDVIGTEISPTALKFPHTIQWDFHETRPEWIGAADFIYSNALDHAFDPQRAVQAWLSCLNPTGILIIEHAHKHGPQYINATDPFGAELEELCELIRTWSAGKYMTEVLVLPKQTHGRDDRRAILVSPVPGERS